MSSLQPSTGLNEANDELDLGDIGRALWRQARRIALVTAAATLVAAWSVLVSRPVFTVNGSLYLGQPQSNAGAIGASGFNFVSDFQSVSDVDTQVALLRSKALLEQVILETGMNARLTGADTPDMAFWRWRFYYGKRIDAFAPRPAEVQVADAVITDPGSGGAAFALVFDGGGAYRLVGGGGVFNPGRTLVSGTLGQPASGAGVALLINPAPDGTAPPAGTRYGLTITPAKAVADALLAGPLVVSAGGSGANPTNLADIQLSCGNPFQGQRFVNRLMTDYVATQLSWKTQSAAATEAFVAGQLVKIQQSLAAADAQLSAYQSKTGIVDVPANAQAMLGQLSQYEVQRTGLLLQQQALSQLAAATAHPVSGINPYLVTQANDPLLGQLAQTLAAALIQRTTMRVQFTAGAPEVQALDAQIGKIEDAMRTAIANDEAQAAGAMANADALIARFEAQLKTMPAQALEVIALTRSSDVFGQLYVLLMQKEEEAQVSKAAAIIDTRVVTPAEIPLLAARPRAAATVLAGMLLGLFAGIGGVLAGRALSGRFQSDDEIRRLVRLPVYGLIPKRTNSDLQRGIFSTNPQSPFSEAFRLLRTNLYQSASGRQARVILVSSAGSGDGKTTIAANLAKILADDGKRVVLVDGDLYRGRVHQALKLDQAPGLTEWLVTMQPSAFQPVAGQRFVVLAAGVFPPNPSELLNEPVLGEILAALRAAFDFVIIDGPPLPAVTDSVTLGQDADLLLSVVKVAHTSRRAFAVHIETLGKLERRHGVVINGVVASAYGYGYAYGYVQGGAGTHGWLARLRRFIRAGGVGA